VQGDVSFSFRLAMGKRASISGTPRQGKRAATVSPSPVEVKPFEVELQLLAQADLPESCQTMLEAMMPHIWSSPEAERHQHQVSMVTTLNDLFAGVVRQKEEALNVSKACVEDAQVALVTLAEHATVAAAEVLSKQELADVAGKQVTGESAARLATTRLAMQAAKTESVELGEKLASAEKDKVVAEEVFSSGWEPLKSDSLGSKEKEDVLKMCQQAFKTYGMGDNFTNALALAVKASGGDREEFATAILEFGDAALKKTISSYAASISELSLLKEQIGVRMREAEVEFASVKDAHSLLEDAMILAENTLLQAQERQDSADEAKAKGEKQIDEAHRTMILAQSELEATQALIARLRKHEQILPIESDPAEDCAQAGEA